MKASSGLKNLILLATYATGGMLLHAETTAPQDARLTWWRDARFGMFIHWGPVSLTGQEISWSRANSNTNCPNNGDTPIEIYDNLYKKFNPTNFNADEWVNLAKSTGMKYMVLTAKHGDGFLLWDSKVDGYNISASPFHRDVCAELSAAAQRQNQPLGWYFSPMDWSDPDCRSANNNRFVKKDQAELRELLSNYGKIDVLWFDLDGLPTMWDPPTTYALVRELQPQILINNRLQMDSFDAWSHQDHLLTNEDFATPEQRIGAYNDKIPWETCMTIGTQWAWKPDDKIKSASELVHILAECAGGDGNLLLNVGPMPDGRIEPRQVDVLKQVGAWVDKNGESIYGTRGGPWKPTKNIASTRKENTIYLHILRKHSDTIELPDIPQRIKSASLLTGGKVNFKQANGKLIITLPSARHDAHDSVVKLKLDGSAMNIPAMALTPDIKATASNIFQNEDANYGAPLAFDEDNQTRWATDNGVKQAWIAIEYQKPKTLSRVHISEAYNRVQKFEFQYRQNDDWKTIFPGTTLGDNFQKSFEPVTGRAFRLNILVATDGPTINEIELSP